MRALRLLLPALLSLSGCEDIADNTAELSHRAGKAAGQAVRKAKEVDLDEVGRKTGEMAEAAGAKAGQAWDETKDAAGQAGARAGEAVREAGQAIKDSGEAAKAGFEEGAAPPPADPDDPADALTESTPQAKHDADADGR